MARLFNADDFNSKVGNTDASVIELDTQVYVDPTKTFTVVVLSGDRFAGVGIAKRNHSDPYDEQTGFDVASGRALQELGRNVEKGAGRPNDGTTHHRKYTYVPISATAYEARGRK